MLDGDGHKMFSEGNLKEQTGKIAIGEHVWVASNATILKGALISNKSVVGARACVTKEFNQENILIGGFNKVLQKNIDWQR